MIDSQGYWMRILSVLIKGNYFKLPLLLVIFAFGVVSHAQDPDDVVRTNVSLVQLNVGVVD